jgi:hypothetical protein
MPQYQSQIHIPEISGISDADAVKINLNLISVQRLINIATLIVFGFYLRGCKLSFKGIGLYYNCPQAKTSRLTPPPRIPP